MNHTWNPSTPRLASHIDKRLCRIELLAGIVAGVALVALVLAAWAVFA